jgi:hypothetical protein
MSLSSMAEPSGSASSERRRFRLGVLVLAGVGATLGSLLDGIHTHFGATAYTEPVALRAAWWVPLLFAGAYATSVARPLLDKGPRPPGWKAAVGMGVFISAYALSVAPWPWGVRAAVLGGLFAAGFWVCDRTRAGLIVAGTAAVCGPVVEAIMVRAGTFVHHEVLVLGIPGWLPFLYLTAGVGLGTLAKWVVG